jgi:hypothetical protein
MVTSFAYNSRRPSKWVGEEEEERAGVYEYTAGYPMRALSTIWHVNVAGDY